MTNAAASAGLPEWDLSDLYAAPDSAELKHDLEKRKRRQKRFLHATKASWRPCPEMSWARRLLRTNGCLKF